jgi:hypothetical protein
MNKYSKVSSYIMVAMLLLGVFFIAAPKVNAAPITLNIVDAVTGSSSLHYTTATKNVGDNIVLNITIGGLVDEALNTYQFRVSWDPTLLDYVSLVRPSDDVFSTIPPGASVLPAGPDTSTPGEVLYGAAVNPVPGTTWGTNSSGRLAQLTLKIIQAVSQGGPVSVTCSLDFENLGADTFLLNALGADISFTPNSATYLYEWIAPTTRPRFTLIPSTIKPAALGDVFSVDVMVSNVDPNWEITAFQFSIMWNTTLMEPTGAIFDKGTFLEAYQYFTPDGVVYAYDYNTHDRPPPQTAILPDYNFSIVGELLLPDPATNDTYHPPFPSGAGKLGTFYFKAIYDTIAPTEYWSSIQFIAEDFLVLNHYNVDIGYDSATNAAYRAPLKVLGLAIDVYTQYDYPYGGQGGNMTSDSFGPQQQVELYALVTYNEYGVQQKLVGFEITHNGYHFAREGTTNVDGIAHISFRLPWPCVDPVSEIFGWWYVNATVEVAEQTVVDNLKFWVWWPVEVVSIEPKLTSYNQTKSGTEMCFEMVYRRYDAQELPVLLTATVYDELGFFIGSAYTFTTVSNDPVTYDIDGNPIPHDYLWEFCISIPSNAVVGKCTVYGNAFTDWPWLGGVPYCPEVTNTIDFYLKKPS